MKRIKLVLCLLSTFISIAVGATYYTSTTPLNTAGKVQELIDDLTIPSGSLAAPAVDGTEWEVIECKNKTKIKAALQINTKELGGSVDGVKKGSCCINAHHEACILLQAQIRSCANTGKGDDSVTTDSSLCPQNK